MLQLEERKATKNLFLWLSIFTFCFSPKVMLVMLLSFLEKCKQETLLFFLQGKVILKCISSTHSSLFHPNTVLTAPVQDKIKLTLLFNIPLNEIHGSFLCLHVGKDYVEELGEYLNTQGITMYFNELFCTKLYQPCHWWRSCACQGCGKPVTTTVELAMTS